MVYAGAVMEFEIHPILDFGSCPPVFGRVRILDLHGGVVR